MIHTIHTLKIKDFALYEETGNESYLIRFKLAKPLFKFWPKKLNKLKEELIKRFNENEYKKIAEKETLRFYYYFMLMQFEAMLYAFSTLRFGGKIKPSMNEWYKSTFGADYSPENIKKILTKRNFYRDKYKETIIENEKKEDSEYTINDMIAGLEGLLGISINRELPVSVLSSYINLAEKKANAAKNVKHG